MRKMRLWVFISLMLSGAQSLAASPVKVLTFNVGTAHVRGFKADCENFKLCHRDAIERIQAFVRDSAPDVMLLNETQGLGQLFGTHAKGPVFDAGEFDASCTKGVSGIFEICVVWRKARFELTGPEDVACRDLWQVNSIGGGALLCSLRARDGSIPRLDAVSVHGSTTADTSRFDLFLSLWHYLIDERVPTVVGGDFNTPDCTSGKLDCRTPAPDAFGTVFGRHVKNEGRWKPKDDFFGYYRLNPKDSKVIAETAATTHYLRRLDHVFANFGDAPLATFNEADSVKQPCAEDSKPWAVRAPFDGGLTIFKDGLGWKTDHYPILSCHQIP